MEFKAAAVTEIKPVGKKGEFDALISVFGNVDRLKDRVNKGAFTKAISEQEPPPIFYAHNWLQGQPPIGQAVDWAQSDDGLKAKGRLYAEEDDAHPLAQMVYAGMRERDGVPPALKTF